MGGKSTDTGYLLAQLLGEGTAATRFPYPTYIGRAEVKEFVADTRGKVWLEALPGYAPDLNPWDEGGWHHLKNVEMRNLVCLDLEELHQEFHLAIGRLRQKPHLVHSFFARAGLRIKKT